MSEIPTTLFLTLLNLMQLQQFSRYENILFLSQAAAVGFKLCSPGVGVTDEAFKCKSGQVYIQMMLISSKTFSPKESETT